MKEQDFLTQLKDLRDYAGTKENHLSKKEIKEYFGEMDLTKEQLDQIIKYLSEHNIEVGGQKRKTEQISSEDSAYLKIYRQEINQLPKRDAEELNAIYARLKNGEEDVVEAAIEAHLHRVVTLANKYRSRGVLLEDLIQEGNLELIMCIHSLLGNTEIEEHRKEIERQVKARMIELVDEAMASEGVENTILAKTNLIHEATKALAEEMGELADIHELAEYTKMTEEEIMEIIELSLDEMKIGECKHHHEHT